MSGAAPPLSTTLFAPFAPPVAPDGPDGRQWLVDELARPVYRAAEPTAFDRAAVAVRDWFLDLFGRGGLGGGVVALVVAVVVLGLVVTAFLVFGRPRASGRRRPEAAAGLFGRDDRRSADELRRAADAAADAGDWVLAVEERFRAIVRGLDERELLDVHPGTTARRAADAAGARLPAERDRLESAALRFDEVRFLDATAGPDDDRRLRDLDRALRSSVAVALPGASGSDLAGGETLAPAPGRPR